MPPVEVVDMSQDSPNVIAVGWSVIRSLVTTRAPTFSGVAAPPDHAVLGEVLQALEREGMGSLQASKQTLDNYVAHLSAVAPSTLGREDALAFWLNLYNAGALALTARATGLNSVLRIPGGFSEPFVTVEGEGLSLDAIEHAKIRRFRDPRIHGALVCGSVSCPTLRRTPYVGASLDRDLDSQMRTFLAGSVSTSPEIVTLSRVFLWYGADFVYVRRMPTFLPATRRQISKALQPWLPVDAREALRAGSGVAFGEYDWGLRCSVG